MENQKIEIPTESPLDLHKQTTSVAPDRKITKSKRPISLAVIVIAILIAGIGIYVISTRYPSRPKDTNNSPDQKVATPGDQAGATDWENYQNTQFGFAFQHPSTF